MTPNHCVGPFRHGPCPFKGVAKKYLLNLLAKGIGWRKLQLHVRQWTCIYGIVTVITHFACKMLVELLVCLFSNAGLISRLGTSQRYLFFLIFMLIFPASGAPAGTITYSRNGASITCHITSCNKGYEVAPCERTGGTDTCRLCPPDKYQAQDNITSHDKLRCYKVVCQPDTHIPVQYGPESPANPPVCECDVGRNFYKAPSDHAGNCHQKFCEKNERLMLNGDCVCKDGRERDNYGQCVWKVSTDLKTPQTNNISLTTMKAISDKRSPKMIPPTSPPSYSHITSTGSSDKDGHRSGGTEQNTPNPSNVRPSLTTTNFWLIVGIFIVIGVICILLVNKCIRKRIRKRGGSNGEETQRLPVNSDNAGNEPIPQLVPDKVIIINAKNAQVGNGNVMFHKDDDENLSMENEEETNDN